MKKEDVNIRFCQGLVLGAWDERDGESSFFTIHDFIVVAVPTGVCPEVERRVVDWGVKKKVQTHKLVCLYF